MISLNNQETMEKREFSIDQLEVSIFENLDEMGKASALHVARQIREVANQKDEVRIIFASAASQLEFLSQLLKQKDILWKKITAFHMDEYHTLPEDAPQRFGNFLREHLFQHISFGEIHYMGEDLNSYAEKIKAAPIDIACLGIGENGHLAFNDPPVADFSDSQMLKTVELDEICRQQQVNDGAFETLSDVPETAVTLTIPALMEAEFLSVVVPGASKAKAVEQTLFGEISTQCPASVLRLHPSATLFLDNQSSQNIEDKIQ